MRDIDQSRRFSFPFRCIPVMSVSFALVPLTAIAAKSADKQRFTGPWELKSLRRAPKVTVLKREGNVTWLYYAGEPFKGEPTRVFAYLAHPKKSKGRNPAMVLVHGGGGTAFQEWAELWAKRGYIALAMDLAGQGPGRKRLPDGGPPQTSAARFDAKKPKDYWTYHAVAAVIRGVSLLAHRPDVDPQRIGITGISWGGYLTCIVAGLDDRLKVAVPVYGCGFIHENSAWLPIFRKMPAERYKLWTQNFEPSRYLAQAEMPALFVNGTNDFAYPLDSYQKSYRLVKNRRLCIRVNMPHGHKAGWAPVEIGLFVDQHLRKGEPLPQVESAKQNGSQTIVQFRSATPIKSAALHFTTDSGDWKKRKWQTRPATVKGTTIRAELTRQRPLAYFVTMTDKRGALVSTEHQVLGK